MRILSLSLFLTLFVGLSSFTLVEQEVAAENFPIVIWEIKDVTGVTFCEDGFAFSATMQGIAINGDFEVNRRFSVDCDGNVTWETPGFDHLGLSDAEMEAILLSLIAEMNFDL